jgi:hypothetical protein
MPTQDIGFPWQRMSADEFADFERTQGVRLIKVNGVYWTRMRPCFYRPLLYFREHSAASVSAPWSSLFGAFQHAVPSSETANSFINMLIFEDPEAYSLQSLNWKRRRQVRLAAKAFTVRVVDDEHEFKEGAYKVYLSFYERSQYTYKPERQRKDVFARWVDSLFRTPKVVVLGGYRNGELGGVSVTQWVEDTLMYSTTFADTASLRMDFNSLILHVIRAAVAGNPQVKRILAGPYKYGTAKGVDDFYLSRGCKLVKKPALLCINPLARAALKCCLPREYARLRGTLDDTGEPERVAEAAHALRSA